MEGPHFILEGPDGAGKTALARQLVGAFDMLYHHEGPPPAKSVGTHYARLLIDARRPTVFDRLHLGELVYGPLLRGGSRLSPTDITMINCAVLETLSSVVICLPPWEVCLSNNRLKEELIKDETVLRMAYDAWAHLAEDTSATIYDYTREDRPCFT